VVRLFDINPIIPIAFCAAILGDYTIHTKDKFPVALLINYHAFRSDEVIRNWHEIKTQLLGPCGCHRI